MTNGTFQVPKKEEDNQKGKASEGVQLSRWYSTLMSECYYPFEKKIGKRNVLLPCGKCLPCLQRKRLDWSFRLKQEKLISDNSRFVTLTYSPQKLPINGKIDKRTIQLYLKRLRVTNKKMKYYFVGEYGSKTKRPHYHAILFNVTDQSISNEWRDVATNEALGFTYSGDVTDASIHYVTGYVLKKYDFIDSKSGRLKSWQYELDKNTGEYIEYDANDLKPFALMSKGLGKIYLKHATQFHKSNFTKQTNFNNQKLRIPRYYYERIFTKAELEILSLSDDIKKQYEKKDLCELRSKRQLTLNKFKNQLKREKL